MYKVKNIKALEELGFKEYQYGYSKKISLPDNFSFIDISFEDLVLKK